MPLKDRSGAEAAATRPICSREDNDQNAPSYMKEGLFARYPQFLERPEIRGRISSSAWTYSQLFGWVHVSHPGQDHKPQSISSKINEILYAMRVHGKTVQDVAGRPLGIGKSG